MASSQQYSTSALYAELNKAINLADYRNALKAANKLIFNSKEAKDDIEPKHCKVVCLIEMGDFAEALSFIESLKLPESQLLFEKAYCQYRLMQSKEALRTLNGVKDPDPRLLELKAQVLYKLGKYKEALSIYKQLIKECSDDFEEERMTNMSAVHAALSAFQGVETEIGFKLETHEQLYNKSCWLLGLNRYTEAEKVLLQAETVCKNFFADDPDVTDEEKEAELSVIRVQLAFAVQCQGRNEEALQIYNQAIRSRPTDLALVAVASNNIISINKDQNVFDSRKKIKATTAGGVDNKLVPHQRERMDYNRALLLMYSNQWDTCHKLVNNLHREYESEVPCMIHTALLCREKNPQHAIEYLEFNDQIKLQGFIERYSDPDLDVKYDLTNIRLTLVQLLLTNGQLDKACTVLESIEKLCYTPAIVSCLVSLYKTRPNPIEHVTSLMESATEWHKKNKSSKDVLKSLLWEYSQFLLQQNEPKVAARTLESLLKLDPDNVKVLAQLVFTYSRFSTSKAHQVSENLPSLEELSVHVDVDELERSASRLIPRYVKKQKGKDKKEGSAAPNQAPKKNVVSEVTASALEIKKRKKKKKKNPTPKDFKAGFVPDPERWIPLRERSYYKSRRKDKRKATSGVGKGTQGSYAGAGESYDASKTASGVPPSVKPSSSASASPGSTPVNSPKPTSTRNVPKGKSQQTRRRKGRK